jgi:hypothetical protein
MTSRPPQTPDVDLNIWLQEVRNELDNRIQSLIVPVTIGLGTSTAVLHGLHSAMQIEAAEIAYFEFIVPHNLKQFKEVTIRFIPTTTGTIDWTVNLSYGGVGEDETVLTKTKTADGLAVTDDQVMEIDITSIFTDQDPGDQVGCQLIVDALSTTTNIYALSLYIKYI